MFEGSCQCGDIRYSLKAEPVNNLLCHCTDCRRSTGAPMVAWAMFNHGDLQLVGEPATFASSEHARRHFCIQCGTSLFYTNSEFLPGMVDVTVASMDEPGLLPPLAHIQTAERIDWMADTHRLPNHEQFPSS